MVSMMHRIISLFIFLNMSISLSQADQIYDACQLPETPAIPVGTVTEEQLLASVSTVKSYQIELGKFRTCLDQLKVPVDKNSMDEETVEKNKRVNAKLDSIYNISVEREQTVVDLLNKQIRLYKTNQE